MSLGETLEDYKRGMAAWVDAARKETAAVQKLQKAVETGNIRDLEKLRQAARNAAEQVALQAQSCPPLEFDAGAYLARSGAFIDELKEAAQQAGVRLYEREGVIYCYPVLVQVEPDLAAVRIDRKLEAGIRPETLAANLKRLQSKEPKSRPEQFVEVLFRAYELVRASRGHVDYVSERLADIYNLLTLLPGSRSDYSELEFTRDIYFLDTSDLKQTRSGATLSLTASTVSRERVGKVYKFVARDGSEKDYASVKFSPAGRGE